MRYSLTVSALAVCAVMSSGSAMAETVKIGLSVPLSGPSAFLGTQAREGVALAIEELNAANPDIQYEMVTTDDMCTPAGGATAFRQLINAENVNVIIGSACSGATLGGMPVLMEGETPAVTFGATNPRVTADAGVGGNPYMWRVNISDQVMGGAFSKFIADNGNKRLAIIAPNNDFGKGGAMVYEAELPKVGVEVATTEYFTPGANDLRNIIVKATSTSPDSILLFGEAPDCALMVRQKAELQLKTNIYSRSGCFLHEAFELMGDPNLANGVTEVANWAPQPDEPVVLAYAKHHPEDPPANTALAYYTMLTVDQAVKAGGTSRQQINDGLAKVDFETAIGQITFDDHHQAHHMMVISVVEDGKAKLLSRVPTTPTP